MRYCGLHSGESVICTHTYIRQGCFSLSCRLFRGVVSAIPSPSPAAGMRAMGTSKILFNGSMR